MTTSFTCEICMETKHISKHSLCPNGHLGGCQKCHMSLIKSLYENDTSVFTGETSAQKCMFCREDLEDALMGEDWGIKLHRIQGLLMKKHIDKSFSKKEFNEIMAQINNIPKPDSFSYSDICPLEDLLLKGHSVNKVCKFINALLTKDLNIKIMVDLYKSYFDIKFDKNLCVKSKYSCCTSNDDDDEIEVEEVEVNGRTLYLDEKTKTYYDPNTSDVVVV